jgi:hypothetical protein
MRRSAELVQSLDTLGIFYLGLSLAATDHLYRIAEDALSNALKHAHANSGSDLMALKISARNRAPVSTGIDIFVVVQWADIQEG